MGTAQRREREARQRRDQILTAARRLFWQQGYERTTVPQIAELAELAPGTLYLYFGGKSEIYAALLEEGYELLRRQLEEQFARPVKGNAQAGAMIDVFLKFAADYPEYFDIIFFVFQRERTDWGDRLPEELVARLHERQDQCKALVGQVLADSALARGPGREGLIDAAWSMLAGVVFFFKTEKNFPAIAAGAKKLLLAALFGTKG